MAKANLKTTVNDASVDDFLNRIGDEARRRDAITVLSLMKGVTKQRPRMWGASIVGFGSYHYKYATGWEADMCRVGFSPRSTGLVLYLTANFKPYAALLKKLGKHKTTVSCLHIKKLDDVNMSVLRELVATAYKRAQASRTS